MLLLGRECELEEGVTVLLTWLTRVAQLQPLGLVVKDRAVKVITGGEDRPLRALFARPFAHPH